MRIGMGYDVHRLVVGRDLIMGGVNIPHSHGLLGHSDADVLTHAIMDSLLGAMALGDIGQHFPDTDMNYKGVDSIRLLEEVRDIMTFHSYEVVNLDATIIAQAPKMAPHIYAMRKIIGKTLKTDIENINIKATTEEGLGFTGEEKGISAQSICLLMKKA